MAKKSDKEVRKCGTDSHFCLWHKLTSWMEKEALKKIWDLCFKIHAMRKTKKSRQAPMMLSEAHSSWLCELRLMGDCDQVQSGTVQGQLVEIGTSHQIRWSILREHNWGVPQSILSLYTMICTYIVHYLIMLWRCVHTGTYTILKLHVWELYFPHSVWMHLESHFGYTGWKQIKKNRNRNFNVFLILPPFYTSTSRWEII